MTVSFYCFELVIKIYIFHSKLPIKFNWTTIYAQNLVKNLLFTISRSKFAVGTTIRNTTPGIIFWLSKFTYFIDYKIKT